MYTGSCLCGDIKFEAKDETLSVMNCHCSMCRKQHGAAYATFIGTQTENVTILSGEDKLTRYRSSEHVERCFCAQCGSSLLFYYSPRPELMWFAAGALDESPEFAPQEHIYVGSKAPWHTITDDLPQYKTYPSQEGNEQNG